jgi:hypothetical protein
MENKKNRAENGKGDAPRNNFSKEYRSRYAAINWKKKEQKPKQNTHKP